MAEQRERGEFSEEELRQQKGEELPDKEVMSLVNARDALPINAAVATNVLSDYAAPTRIPHKTRSSTRAKGRREKKAT
jgi:hypothetical protein